MIAEEIEVLLVEDNPSDQELTLRSLRKEGLANRIQVANDGEEALDFLFCRTVTASAASTTPQAGLAGLETAESGRDGGVAPN